MIICYLVTFNIKTKTFSKQTHEADQPDYALIMHWFYYINLLPSCKPFSIVKQRPFLNMLMKLTNQRKLGEIDWPRSRISELLAGQI